MKTAVLLSVMVSATALAGTTLAADQPGATGVAPKAATTPDLPSITLPPELDRVLRDYEKAWVAGDTAALAALFSADGFALPNGQMPAGGADAIRAAYQRNAGSPLSLRALHYAQSGDMAYIIGGFGSAAGKPDFGKFVLVLRRGQDGRWRIAADMDNANAAPLRKAGA
jgi:ketosteroid isomerase-like protein